MRRKRNTVALAGESLESRHLAIVINEIHYDSEIKVEAAELSNCTTPARPRSICPIGRSATRSVTNFPRELQLLRGTSSWPKMRRSPPNGGCRFARPGKDARRRGSSDARRVERFDHDVEYQIGFPADRGRIERPLIQLVNATLDNNLGGSWRISSGGQAATELVDALNWRYRKGTAEAFAGRCLASAWFCDSSWSSAVADRMSRHQYHARRYAEYSTVYCAKFDAANVSSFWTLVAGPLDDGICLD
jgi:hypothetical protein